MDNVDFGNIKNNPGFKKCMVCGGPLPPSEDGSERFRPQPEACDRCVHANINKIVCSDGVTRDRSSCKKVVKINDLTKDENVSWVKK